MDFQLNTEQQQLKSAAERFVRERCGFALWHRKHTAGRALGAELWPALAEMGWLALPFAEADGGYGAGPVETMLVMQALGRGLVAEPYLQCCVWPGALLCASAAAGGRKRRIDGLLSGECRVAVVAEAPGASGLRAERCDTGWWLSGQAGTVHGAGDAQALIVAARDADDRTTLFWLAADAPGLIRHARRLVDGGACATLVFGRVHLPHDAAVGAVGEGQTLLVRAEAHALAAMGAEAMALMDLLLEQTIAYTSARRQFGQPLAHFQVLRHRMVEMFMAAEQMRSLLLLATMRLAEGDADASRALSALKVQLGQAGRFISQQAVQLHGGMGITDEIVIGHAFKRLMVLDAMGGNVDHHLRRFAQLQRPGTLARPAQEGQSSLA